MIIQSEPHTYAAYRLVHNGILALARAEQQGIRVDMDYVQRKKTILTHKIERLEGSFKQTTFYRHWEHARQGKVNINSNIQLSHFLYNTKKIKPARLTETGNGATDEETLKQLNIPELTLLLEIRKLKKMRDTYLDSFAREQVNGYVHPFFNLHLVRTHRSSSDHPNFQNIPKRDDEAMRITRKALFPRPGHQLMEVDFSGLEVRIAACYHRDPTMLNYIRNPKSDMHTDMAKEIFKLDKFDKANPAHSTLRSATKNGFVFPEFYGDYYKNCAYILACSWGQLPAGKWTAGQGIALTDTLCLSDHLIAKGIRSLMAFEDHLQDIEQDFWNKRFPVYQQWKESWWRMYKKFGTIGTLTGFKCGGVMSRNDAINYPVQGAAFHCLLWSFIEMDRIIMAEHLDSRLIGQIHDSMILDVNPNEIDYITNVVYRVTCEDLPKAWDWIIVPMDVEIELAPVDCSWADKAKYNLK